MAERDLDLRRAAIRHLRTLSQLFDDVIPVEALRDGFQFERQRISYGSFFNGIYRPRAMRGPAALAIVTAPPKGGRDAPYDDAFNEATGRFLYHYRTAQQPSARAVAAAESDNATLRAAFQLAVPLIYFHGIAPGQYTPVAPVFVTADDPDTRTVELEAALTSQDLSQLGPQSEPDVRRYATREARYRLHQHRFRGLVLGAYESRCAVCSLRESALLQAAHITEDSDVQGDAVVVNGISLCAIHHLAYDRNLLGIDPTGVVHISSRLLRETDGPMLANGLQHFHGAQMLRPKRRAEHPDPARLERRFDAFRAAS